MAQAYDELLDRLRDAARLASVAHLLGWDQETMMPPKAAGCRAEELELVAELAHRRSIDPQIGELLGACEADASLAADPVVSANLREIRRDYDRARRLPPKLVAEMNGTSSRAIEAWKRARQQSDFGQFAPWLERQLDLNRRKAECYGYPADGEPYDALVEDYEPGMTGAELERLFAPLRDELTPLIAEIARAGSARDPAPLEVELPIEVQQRFNRQVLEKVGFDLQAGRLDVSVHPFSSGVAPHDTRITSRYTKDRFPEALGSTLHEAGHGLYEQGLPKERHWGQPLGEALGLGIHESQSRLWENFVGRSRAFWSWALPQAKELFRPALDRFGVEELFGAVNRVHPNLIRVESDEATYNLHVMIRFDLERAMLRGDLSVNDLPAAWNARMKSDLGLDVPDDARGCLQDIHWSMGSIGYFPTYTLGNLYSAQLWETIQQEIPDLEQQIQRGAFEDLLDWLREKIHRRGRQVPAGELCVELTGRPLDHVALMRHLTGKFGAVYGLSDPAGTTS